jgi:hypothetical protein
LKILKVRVVKIENGSTKRLTPAYNPPAQPHQQRQFRQKQSHLHFTNTDSLAAIGGAYMSVNKALVSKVQLFQ